MQRFAAGNKRSRGWAAFTDVKRRVNRSGVVMRCGHPRDRWHANYRSEPLREPGVLFALNAKLTTNTVSDTTTSNAAVETAAAIRASACSTHASFEETRRLCVPSCSGARRAHRSLAQEAGRKRCTLPAGGVNERRCGGGQCDRSWPTTLRKMRQRDRPRSHCNCRSQSEQRASDSRSVSSRETLWCMRRHHPC